MLVMVEGPRNVGKTFLVDSLLATDSCSHYYKFPYAALDKLINRRVDDHEEFMGGLSIGKDLQLLHLAKDRLVGYLENVIVDRSIISTLVYGLIFGRFSEQYVRDIISYIKDNDLLNNDVVSTVMIYGTNPFPRPVKDLRKFEDLDYMRQVSVYQNLMSILCLTTGFKYKTFINQFDMESQTKFVELYKGELI